MNPRRTSSSQDGRKNNNTGRKKKLQQQPVMETEQVGPMEGFVFDKNKDGTINKQAVICKHCTKKFSFHRSCTTFVGASSETDGMRSLNAFRCSKQGYVRPRN